MRFQEMKDTNNDYRKYDDEIEDARDDWHVMDKITFMTKWCWRWRILKEIFDYISNICYIPKGRMKRNENILWNII